MTWDASLTADVEALFAPLILCIDVSEPWATEHGGGRGGEASAAAKARRETKRAERVASDPAYAARRKAQLRRASKRAEAKRKAARTAAARRLRVAEGERK